MAVSDIVVEPVGQTAKGFGKGALWGGVTMGAIGAVVGGGLTLGALAFLGASLPVTLAIGAVVAAVSAAIGFIPGAAAGAAGGSVIGLGVGGYKGVKGFTKGVVNAVSDAPDGDSRQVTELRAQSDITAAQLAAYRQERAQEEAVMRQRAQERAQAQAAVADPDAPANNVTRVTATASVERGAAAAPAV